jgi:chromosome segregation ATPase
MLTVVSDGLGIPAMRDTINTLQQRNEALQQQVQELHNRTESVANSMESVQTSITEVVSNQKAISESWENKMKQTVEEALSGIAHQQQQQQQLQAQQHTMAIQEAIQLAMQQQAKQQHDSMQQMFQQFMLMSKQPPEQSTQPDTTAPTSVMIGSEHEVSSLTTEAQSPGKRSQASAALPQVTTQKKTRPDPHPPSPAGTPCTDHPTAITGEETRGDAT